MKVSSLIGFILCLLLVSVVNCKNQQSELKVEYIKKNENCEIRSRNGDILHIDYIGKLEDGTEFDSTVRKDRPHIFELGKGDVIKGWDLGLLDMCEGELRRLTIPSHLAYGERREGSIPPHATLIFDCRLAKLERYEKTEF